MKTTKYLIASASILISTSASAFCNKYESSPVRWKALQTLASHRGETLRQLCTHNNLLDVYATPSRIITRDGEIIPHTRIELTYAYHTCQYMISEIDQTITKEYCYSTY